MIEIPCENPSSPNLRLQKVWQWSDDGLAELCSMRGKLRKLNEGEAGEYWEKLGYTSEF